MNKMSNIREPIKKTSIEKKQKIIEKGFELMCKEGFYNVNCVDIAKYADVSTGSIYQYFNDKRDIFIAGVKNYSNAIMFPMIDVIKSKKITKDNLDEVLNEVIESFINTHKISRVEHEELIAMSHLDDEIGKIFKQNEIDMTNNISKVLENNGFSIENIEEKIHIIFGLVDNYCHEAIYHRHDSLDYRVMKENIIDIIKYILR